MLTMRWLESLDTIHIPMSTNNNLLIPSLCPELVDVPATDGIPRSRTTLVHYDLRGQRNRRGGMGVASTSIVSEPAYRRATPRKRRAGVFNAVAQMFM